MATPLITAMYALAGTPVPGTYPVTYPYQEPHQSADLFDITQGANGACGTLVLCTAGPGWDGPTGLGTPDGVGALTGGPHGDITGQVTDAATGKPVAGATVTAAGGYAATTGADGSYDLYVPPGSYTVTAQAFGYQAAAQPGVTVTAGQATTANFALAAAPEATCPERSPTAPGTGWPLYAKITISGDPDPVYTSPCTGAYSVSLPQQASYTLHVIARLSRGTPGP